MRSFSWCTSRRQGEERKLAVAELRVIVVDDDEWKRSAMAERLDATTEVDVALGSVRTDGLSVAIGVIAHVK